jgi:hypothetical protein
MKMKSVEFTQYIAPDGNIYKFDSVDRFLMSEEGFGLPPIEYITQKGPFQHGETLVDFRLGPRIIQLQLRQDSCSRALYWDNRSNLLDAIRPNRNVGSTVSSGVLRRIFEDGTIKDINAIIEQGPGFVAKQIGRWDEWGFTEMLRFICHDPLFFNPIQKSITFDNLVSGSDDDWVLPWSFPMLFGGSAFALSGNIVYPGTWLDYPTIVIVGPVNGLIITNVSTGEFIEFNYSIADGETVTISLEPGNKSVTNQLGTNLLGVITPDSDLATFHIAPNPEVANGLNEIDLTLSGADAGSSVSISYYERYIGL